MGDEYQVAELIAEHYQKTYEITYEFWKQRNRLFVLLLLALGVGPIFALEEPSNQDNILAYLISVLGAEYTDITIIQDTLILKFLQSILMVVVFFLIFNLYHRSTAVLRNYQYLGVLEKELRELLQIREGKVAFTREGEFYWRFRDTHPWFSPTRIGLALSKLVYIFLLLFLLSAFFYIRISLDIRHNPFLVTLFDITVAVLTCIYYLAYVFSSLRLDRAA